MKLNKYVVYNYLFNFHITIQLFYIVNGINRIYIPIYIPIYIYIYIYIYTVYIYIYIYNIYVYVYEYRYNT